MNQVVYEQFVLGLRKCLFMFVCLSNKSNSSLILGSTIKGVKFKHNNVFMNMRLDLTIIILYLVTICLKIYL